MNELLFQQHLNHPPDYYSTGNTIKSPIISPSSESCSHFEEVTWPTGPARLSHQSASAPPWKKTKQVNLKQNDGLETG